MPCNLLVNANGNAMPSQYQCQRLSNVNANANLTSMPWHSAVHTMSFPCCCRCYCRLLSMPLQAVVNAHACPLSTPCYSNVHVAVPFSIVNAIPAQPCPMHSIPLTFACLLNANPMTNPCCYRSIAIPMAVPCQPNRSTGSPQ